MAPHGIAVSLYGPSVDLYGSDFLSPPYAPCMLDYGALWALYGYVGLLTPNLRTKFVNPDLLWTLYRPV